MAEIVCYNEELIVVDDDLFDELDQYVWYFNEKTGAQRQLGKSTISIGRHIMDPPEHLWVGYLDRDKTNCVRDNLFLFEPKTQKETREKILRERKGVPQPYQIQQCESKEWVLAHQGGKSTKVFVDPDVWDKVAPFYWNWCQHGAWRKVNGESIYVQQVVTGAKKRTSVIFLDDDKANCRRANLKVMT